MVVKIINRSSNPLPAYQSENAAGLDLCAQIESAVTIKPFNRVLIGTGLYMELPVGYEAQIRPRSGLALKKGVTILNTPGTIDADYRGEIKVLLVNVSNETVLISNGERIAQMIISKHEKISWDKVEILSTTDRGIGGYGSTGNL